MSDYTPEQIDPDAIRRMISEGRARQLDRAVDRIEEVTAERDELRADLRDVGEALGDDWAITEATVAQGVQAVVDERDRLREQVQGGRRLRFKLAGRNTRLRGVIENAVAVFGAEEMDYDAWTEGLGRMRRSLDVDDALNFGVEGGEVAGPTSPEYDAVVNQLMDIADERDRLRSERDELHEKVKAAIIGIDTVLVGDNVDMGMTGGQLLGAIVAGLTGTLTAKEGT